MKTVDATKFHKLYGVKRQRITYHNKDFLDYVIMILMSAALIRFAYGANHAVSIIGWVLCAFMVATFPMRHGVQFRTPLILTRPQDILYSLIHKLQNIKPAYFVAIGVLILENYIIVLTPRLPHNVELAHTIALCLFWRHFILMSSYRTAILI